MSLFLQIKTDLTAAVREKNEMKTTTLRMLISAIQNKEIEERRKDTGLSDEELQAVIRTEVKKRSDAASDYQKAGRAELQESEEQEKEILQAYLPPELADSEVLRIVEESVREAGAESMQDFGNVMGIAMKAMQGKASGDRVSAAVRALLAKKSAKL